MSQSLKCQIYRVYFNPQEVDLSLKKYFSLNYQLNLPTEFVILKEWLKQLVIAQMESKWLNGSQKVQGFI